ncbi:MAG: ABC transporter permease [Candidatus Portnoybacteria bacterium]|nr:ABC transporter permease [Candidatus Portnoybacteria bacterium]
MEKSILIKPKKGLNSIDLKEMWRQKELFYFFTWRDLKVRYKQTAIGFLWAIFQPFIAMIVFSVFFGGLANMPSDGIPYPIFVYVGLLLWQFFSKSISAASNSLISNKSIITKAYFPRLILPTSSIITNFIDFLIASGILVGLMVYYSYSPNMVGLLIIPLLLVITFLVAMGVGLLLAAINVKYRDVRHVLPFFIQMLLFVTPVIYPTSILQNYSWILAINPMTGVIKASRAAILGTASIDWTLLLISGISSIILFFAGLIYFKKTEKNFTDII